MRRPLHFTVLELVELSVMPAGRGGIKRGKRGRHTFEGLKMVNVILYLRLDVCVLISFSKVHTCYIWGTNSTAACIHDVLAAKLQHSLSYSTECCSSTVCAKRFYVILFMTCSWTMWFIMWFEPWSWNKHSKPPYNLNSNNLDISCRT